MPDKRPVLESLDLTRAWRRVGHEIAEAHPTSNHIILVGIQRGGVALSKQLGKTLADIYGHEIKTGSVEPGLHRDDLSNRAMSELLPTELPKDITGQIVILVDDVFYTGRTVRASIDALLGFGRPQCIQLAALIDRGHRELPIRADYIGKNLPTHPEERVEVQTTEEGVPQSVMIQSL
jgi:pyrimidine operon attenuation protein/uracil phosphoribosyltransferase